jgi:hypothetical protein
MRAERSGNRKRLFTLLGGAFMGVLGVVALGSLATLGRRTLDEKWYTHPDRTLRGLAEAEERYRLHDLDEDGRQDYAPSLEALEAAGQITHALATEEVRGYRYALRLEGDGFVATATPDVAVVGTDALFYSVDRFQVVRAARGGPPGPDAGVFWHPVYQNSLWQGEVPAALDEAGEAPR